MSIQDIHVLEMDSQVTTIPAFALENTAIIRSMTITCTSTHTELLQALLNAVDELKAQLSRMTDRMTALERRVDGVESRVTRLEERDVVPEGRLDSVKARAKGYNDKGSSKQTSAEA